MWGGGWGQTESTETCGCPFEWTFNCLINDLIAVFSWADAGFTTIGEVCIPGKFCGLFLSWIICCKNPSGAECAAFVGWPLAAKWFSNCVFVWKKNKQKYFLFPYEKDGWRKFFFPISFLRFENYRPAFDWTIASQDLTSVLPEVSQMDYDSFACLIIPTPEWHIVILIDSVPLDSTTSNAPIVRVLRSPFAGGTFDFALVEASDIEATTLDRRSLVLVNCCLAFQLTLDSEHRDFDLTSEKKDNFLITHYFLNQNI